MCVLLPPLTFISVHTNFQQTIMTTILSTTDILQKCYKHICRWTIQIKCNIMCTQWYPVILCSNNKQMKSEKQQQQQDLRKQKSAGKSIFYRKSNIRGMKWLRRESKTSLNLTFLLKSLNISFLSAHISSFKVPSIVLCFC